MANQRLQEILEQEQKKLREELNASNFLKEINNPERKRWFRSQPYEKMPDKLYKILNDPLVKYITDLNSSNKERILKATSKEKLKQEIDNLKNKIAASPRYDLKYAGLLEGPFAAKPRISGAVEWSIKFLTVIAIAIAIAAIVITSSAGLGITPFLISSLVAVPACYAAMRFTRGWMFGTQQNDLLRTSTLELELETFQAKIKALGEQQKFFRDDTEGKKYVKNLTKTLNSDLVQTYSKQSTDETIKNHIQNNLLKYNGKDKSTLNQLKANLTTLIDTNKFVEFNKDNQTLEKNINLDFDKNERVIKAVQALVDSKLAENAQNVLDLRNAKFLTPKGSNNTYIISGKKVYLFNGSEVTDTGLDGKGNNIATGIAVYDKSTGNDLENANYLEELKKISGLEPNNDVNNVKNLIENIGKSKSFENYNGDVTITQVQYDILKNITNASRHLETNQTQAFSDTITNIISDIYNNKDIPNEKLEQQISNLNWKPSNNEKAATEAAADAEAKAAAEAAAEAADEEARKAADEAATKAAHLNSLKEEAAKAAKTPAQEIKELLQALKAEVNEDKGSGPANEQGEIQTILKNLKDNGGIPDSENISDLFRKILDSAKDIQEPLIGEMRNLGISLKPGNNIELPSTMSHIMGKQDKGR